MMKVFIPGETVPDPPCLPQDWDSLYAATLESIRNPIGMPPLRELAGKGSRVVFIIPDIVKGGCQPTSHRKVAIRACLDELYAVTGEAFEKSVVVLRRLDGESRRIIPETINALTGEIFADAVTVKVPAAAVRCRPHRLYPGAVLFKRHVFHKISPAA